MQIKKLFMDRNIKPSEETDYLIERVGLVPEYVGDSRIVYDYVNDSEDPISKAKETLYITENNGATIRECPGTSHYTCCEYTILHTGTFCTMDCSYCILQAYFHPPVLQYFAGEEKLFAELDSIFARKKTFRVGTGEFTDSLIWERLCRQPAKLVEKFAAQKHSILELKTKTVNIESLKGIDHNQKSVISWSLNTPAVIKSEERGTSSLKARLAAAKKCEEWGYRIGFHFDPLVIYEGCEEEYRGVIKAIFEGISSGETGIRPESIVWISLGTFRFMPHLKQIIEKRFTGSRIPYGEFITGLDNKMRYFKPLRIALFRKIVSFIREYSSDVPVYFCMEDREVWEKSIGFFPEGESGLAEMLDRSVIEKCNLSTGM